MLSLLLFAGIPCFCQSSETLPTPILSGVVTRLGSASDFDVNGTRILLDSKTDIREEFKKGSGTGVELSSLSLNVGDSLDIYGKEVNKPRGIRADMVVLHPFEPESVSGVAVVEAVLQPDSNSHFKLMVRADGYSIGVTAETNIKLIDPVKSKSDIGPDVVIKYQGTEQPGGIVVAKEALFSKNQVSAARLKEESRWDYDPYSVAADSKQSRTDKAFRGIDPSKFPLHRDDAVQRRVSAAGGKLIPAYQKALTDKDPTRINFRLFVVDAPKIRDAFALPNGIILIPFDVVQRMQNDSQLASILADKVAMLLEQQPVPQPETNGQVAEGMGMTAASFIPIAGLAVDAYGLGSGIHSSVQARAYLRQRERVSLSLLHDGGFDLLEAPKAWWLLSQKKPKDVAGTKPPARTVSMYGLLGTIWISKP